MKTWICSLLQTPLRRRVKPAVFPQSVDELEDRRLLAADLVLQDVHFSSIGPENALHFIQLNTEVTIANLGDATAADSTISLWVFLSTDQILGNADDVAVGETIVDLNVLASGSQAATSVEVILLSEYLANEFLLVKIDFDNEIAEDNEGNNIAVMGLPGLATFVASAGTTEAKAKTVAIDPLITFSDSDTTNFNGSELKVAFENISTTKDTISIKKLKTPDGVLKRKGDKVLLGKTVLGNIAGGTGGPFPDFEHLTITFTTDLNAQRVQQIASAVSFTKGPRSTNFHVLAFSLTEQTGFSGVIAIKGVSFI